MKKKIWSVFISVFMLVALAFGVSACNKEKMKEKVEELIYSEPKNLCYDGAYITWDKVELANHYTVAINDGEAKRSNSTTFAYESNETFDVTVTSVFDECEKSASITFTPLATIETVHIGQDGSLSWDSVGGATAYLLNINGTETTVETASYTALAEGSNRVKVRPIVSGDNSYYSKWSEEVNVYVYSAPTNVKYDGLNLSWSGNASTYEVKFNGTAQTVTGNTVVYDSKNTDFTVEVKALGNHTTSYDSKVVSEEFHYLDPVTDLIMQDGILSWNATENAEGYKVKVNGVVQTATVQTPAYDKLASGRALDVSVIPYNQSGNYFSSWSIEKAVYILDAPTTFWNNDLELDGEANNNLTWNAVSAASGYTVRFTKDGQESVQTFSDISRAFSHAYADVGVYTLEVKANANGAGTDYYDSKYSAPITVQRLAAPTAASANFIVSDRDNVSSGFTVNFEQVAGASGYQLYKDGVLLSGRYTTGTSLSDSNVVDNSNIGQQEYNYTVRSMGGVKTVGGNTYVTLPCLSVSALNVPITVQATPQNPRMSGYTFSWDSVTGNNAYAVSYAGSSITAQTENCDLSTLNAGTYAVAVCARGNGSNVLASTYSQPLTVQRLQAPTNIKITSASNGTLDWDDVSNATGYEVYLDLSATPLNENNYNNMYQFIRTDGTTVSMVAVANKYNDQETVYYMTSKVSPTQQFIRLAAPTFPEGALENSLELIWNTPTNINTAEYTPSYRVYSAVGEEIGNGAQNGTKFNIEYLQGGQAHTFYVKAIGNDTKYLDSDYSLVFTVYKLATPQFSIQDGKYVWSGVTNASSYYMEVDGVKVSDNIAVAGTTYSYTPRFTTSGDHIVTLKAIGDARATADSAIFRFIQRAELLQKPQMTFSYSSDCYVSGGAITVNITSAVSNCLQYQYEIAGETIVSDQLSCSKIIENHGKHTIRVKALGGQFDNNGVYYIDSLYVGGTANETITLLSAPSDFSINSYGVIQWSGITGAFGYDYQISYEGASFGNVQTSGYASLNPIEGYNQYRTITIRVQAKGDNNNVVSSEWVEWTWTNANYQG